MGKLVGVSAIVICSPVDRPSHSHFIMNVLRGGIFFFWVLVNNSVGG